MKRHLTLLLTAVFVASYVPAKANDSLSSAQSDHEPKVGVLVQNYAEKSGEEHKHYFTIIASSYGRASTLDSAKMLAIKTILPELISQTEDLGDIYKSETHVGGIKTEQGVQEIEAENTHIKGSWTYEDGVYLYVIELYIKHSNNTEKSGE